jgi:hypothetical protein
MKNRSLNYLVYTLAILAFLSFSCKKDETSTPAKERCITCEYTALGQAIKSPEQCSSVPADLERVKQGIEEQAKALGVTVTCSYRDK